jgi:hypothetical protein
MRLRRIRFEIVVRKYTFASIERLTRLYQAVCFQPGFRVLRCLLAFPMLAIPIGGS